MLVAPHRALLAAALAVCVLARAAAPAATPSPEDASRDHARAPANATPVTPAVCLEAVVSPVSGFAECVNPRGAPVQPPPPRPQSPCEAAGRDCAGDTTREPQTQR